MVRQEQYKDLLREAKLERMVKILEPRLGHYRAFTAWRNAQVTKWSLTLQRYVLGKEKQIWRGYLEIELARTMNEDKFREAGH